MDTVGWKVQRINRAERVGFRPSYVINDRIVENPLCDFPLQDFISGDTCCGLSGNASSTSDRHLVPLIVLDDEYLHFRVEIQVGAIPWRRLLFRGPKSEAEEAEVHVRKKVKNFANRFQNQKMGSLPLRRLPSEVAQTKNDSSEARSLSSPAVPGGQA